jgi:hypothetical protein
MSSKELRLKKQGYCLVRMFAPIDDAGWPEAGSTAKADGQP